MSYDEIRPIFQARFDANMRFLFKSREEMEEEDRETVFKKPDGQDAVWKSQRSVHGLALKISTFKVHTETIEINKDIDWDAEIDHVKQKSKENPQYIKFDANIRFLFKSREEMEEEDREVLKSINETPTQKASKRRKLNEEAQEVEDLKKYLEVVNDEDDEIFIEATSLARKLILLVERRYPLLKFTLEQLVNVTRLQVEEESEMSLELIRFTKQQLHEYQQG
uniref:Uncharacterized protein n=2 Tax=Tanacetum cinerariifolium TaxID=118510 RepID=A0A6L2MM99_TANCI|nr:hypothetical protein [Tanacetum cinerariifolium]